MQWIFYSVAFICIALVLIAALDSYDKSNGKDDDK